MPRKSLGAVAASCLAVAGCGSADGHGRPTVYAASSLRAALPALLPDATYQFAGSNQLRVQIEHGAPADVLIGASPKDPQALVKAGRCEAPVEVATNELVIVVPRGRPALTLAALRRGGHRIAIGAPGVPIGDYTRKLLATAGATAVLHRNTVSSEPSVASIVAKVRLRSADAAFAYVTDARGLRAVRLPRSAQPVVRYEACAVRPAGRSYVRALRSAATQDGFVARGFGRAP